MSRCELCLGSTHSTADCVLLVDPDPDMRDRVKAVEATLLAVASRQRRQAGDQPTQWATQVCWLFNQGRCNFAKCKYIHKCLQCRGSTQCPDASAGDPQVGSQVGYSQKDVRPFRNPECSSGSHRPCQPNRVYLGLDGILPCFPPENTVELRIDSL